jgi:hypothetical protein
MGDPADLAVPQSTEGEEETKIPPSGTEELDTAEKLGIGKPGFLFPFTFGTEPATTLGARRKLPSSFGGGGIVATTANVVSPTR